ncbi:MAG: hypothetical protein P8R54_12430 [Myxococcota bacterium]|nr:hypothetical protein [Myxococcota bacterium]
MQLLKTLMIMLYPLTPAVMERPWVALRLPGDVFSVDPPVTPMAAGHVLAMVYRMTEAQLSAQSPPAQCCSTTPPRRTSMSRSGADRSRRTPRAPR